MFLRFDFTGYIEAEAFGVLNLYFSIKYLSGERCKKNTLFLFDFQSVPLYYSL